MIRVLVTFSFLFSYSSSSNTLTSSIH